MLTAEALVSHQGGRPACAVARDADVRGGGGGGGGGGDRDRDRDRDRDGDGDRDRDRDGDGDNDGGSIAQPQMCDDDDTNLDDMMPLPPPVEGPGDQQPSPEQSPAREDVNDRIEAYDKNVKDLVQMPYEFRYEVRRRRKQRALLKTSLTLLTKLDVELLEWLHDNHVAEENSVALFKNINARLNAEHTEHNSTQLLPRDMDELLKRVAPKDLRTDDATKEAKSADYLSMSIVDPNGEFESTTNVMGDPVAAYCDAMTSPLVHHPRDSRLDAECLMIDDERNFGELMRGDFALNTQARERCAPALSKQAFLLPLSRTSKQPCFLKFKSVSEIVCSKACVIIHWRICASRQRVTGDKVLAGESVKLALLQFGMDKTHLDQQGRMCVTPLIIFAGNLCASLVKRGVCSPAGYFNIKGRFAKGLKGPALTKAKLRFYHQQVLALSNHLDAVYEKGFLLEIDGVLRHFVPIVAFNMVDFPQACDNMCAYSNWRSALLCALCDKAREDFVRGPSFVCLFFVYLGGRPHFGRAAGVPARGTS
jgi:hypothetical protein